MSRHADPLRDIPPATASVIGICTLLYGVQALIGPELIALTLCPRRVLYLTDWYRIITSALYHGSMMHLGMNMMSTAAIGSMLERRMGTLRLWITTLWAILLTSTLYIFVAWLLSLARYDSLMFQHSVGFSGVLFHWAVLEANHLGSHSPAGRSIFGVASVPAPMYPWVLLVALQFIMPNLSFMGHLAGIITGTLQVYGLFEPLAMPAESFLKETDDWMAVRPIYTRLGFVPGGSFETRDAGALYEGLVYASSVAFAWVGHVVNAACVIIFGRGRTVNDNLRWGTWSRVGTADDEYGAVV